MYKPNRQIFLRVWNRQNHRSIRVFEGMVTSYCPNLLPPTFHKHPNQGF